MTIWNKNHLNRCSYIIFHIAWDEFDLHIFRFILKSLDLLELNKEFDRLNLRFFFYHGIFFVFFLLFLFFCGVRIKCQCSQHLFDSDFWDQTGVICKLSLFCLDKYLKQEALHFLSQNSLQIFFFKDVLFWVN